MAEHVWSVLCQKVLINQETQLVSLVEIPEKFIADISQGGPVEELNRALDQGKKGVRYPVALQLVSWWVRSNYSKAEKVEIRISVFDPSGEQLSYQNWELDLSESTGFRAIFKLNQIFVTGHGLYWYVVDRKIGKGKNPRWETVARLPLEITV